MKIALILGTPGSTWGGMETHTRDLARGLAGLGVEVHVLAHPAYQNHFTAPVSFHGLPLDRSRRHPWLRHRLRQHVKTLGPDIVHAQGHKAATLLHALPRKRNRAAVLGTIHGEKRSNRAFDALDGVIAVNHRLLDRLTHPMTRVIRNGAIATPRPMARPAGCPDGHPLLLAMGRLEPVKQFDRLILAWAAIDTPGHLVILGEGRERDALGDLIRELGIEERTHLPGPQHDAAAWPHFADLCVLSSAREGLPYSVIEALLARCPVVSTPVGDIPDFLPDPCIAQNTDQASITRLLKDTVDRWPSLAEEQIRAFRFAETELSVTSMVDDTVRFYQQCLEHRGDD